MKKKFLLAATALFTVGALALAGCGEQTTGEISGKYKEATAEEVATAYEKVDFAKSLGDITADDWSFNFQAEGETTANVDLSMSFLYGGLPMSVTCQAQSTESFSYLVSLANGEDGISAYGAGSAKAKVEGAATMSGLNMSLDADEEWKIYHDDTAVYIDPVKKSKIFSTKTKISLDDMIDGVEDEIPELPQTPSLPTEPETPEDLKAMIDGLIESGAKISLDQRKGLKMKFSFDKETATKLIAENGDALAALQANIELNTFALDIYVALDDDGLFEAIGIVFDIDASVSMKSEEVTLSGTVAFKGGYSIKASKSTAKLPDGIATDSEYQDFDIDSLLGGMGGIGGFIGSGSKYPV